jgi:hypothetical protein
VRGSVLGLGRGKLSPADCAVYVVAQCAGAFVGALLGSAIGGAAVGVAVVETNTRLAGFAAEMLYVLSFIGLRLFFIVRWLLLSSFFCAWREVYVGIGLAWVARLVWLFGD